MDIKLRECLNDILVNANEVLEFVNGMSFETDLAHLISDVENLI